MKNSVFRLSVIITLLILFTLNNSLSISQEKITSKNEGKSNNSTIRIFLDCDFCDHSYIKRTIPYIDFTRDPKQAQLHVLITVQHTASGGHLFTLDIIGQEEYKGKDQQLTYNSEQSETDDLMRKGLTRTLLMGLMPYLSQTPIASQIQISYDGDDSQEFEQRTNDPWNFWVFRIDLSGDLEAEKSQNEITFSNTLRAERITENWKFLSRFYYRHEREQFKDDEEEITSSLKNGEFEIGLVKSLTSHWSLGVFSDVVHSTYTNLDGQFSFSPAIEYNFYPWKLSNRKILTIGYYLGYRYNDYIKETLYDKLSENLFYHDVGIQAEFVQPWGELDAELHYFHYFHDSKFYKVESEFDISLRITKGLSLFLETNAEGIHDQIYLPKGDVSLEDKLLKRRRLETNYDVRFEIGIRFTFGSIYNNIVNHRF